MTNELLNPQPERVHRNEVSWTFFGWLGAAIITAYALVVALGFFMPLQNDEVSELLLNHRAWIDGKTLIGLLPQCGKEAFFHKLPWIWYAPAYVSYLTYGQMDNPVWIRIAGIAQFLAWLTLWTAIAMKLFAVPKRRWWAALAVILGFIGWDALPLGLLINRPEQTLLIGAGLAVALALYAEIFRTRALKILGTIAMLLAVMCMHASHPKAIALLPLELVMYGAFLYKAWRHRIATFAGMAVIAWMAVQSYGLWSARVQCPGSEEARQYYQTFYLPLSMLWHSPLAFLSSAVNNIMASLLSNFYLDNYSLVSRIWLPLGLQPLNVFTTKMIYLLDMDAWLIHILFLGCACWIAVRHGLPHPGRKDGKSVWRLGLLALLAFIGAIFIVMTEGIFYAVALTIPLILLASLLAFGIADPTPWRNAWAVRIAVVVMFGSIANQGLLLYRYAGFADPRRAYESLPINHEAFSSTHGYAQKKAEIRELAAQCGIDDNAKHVAVDDVTYHALRKTYQPLFFADSTWGCCHQPLPESKWFHLESYLQLLRSYDSDGIVAQCTLFPKALRELSQEKYGLCCVPKEKLQSTP